MYEDMTAIQAWNLAGRVASMKSDTEKFGNIFPNMELDDVFKDSPYKVQNKIREYECDVKPGDVIQIEDGFSTVVLVLDVTAIGTFVGIDCNGCCDCWMTSKIKFKMLARSEKVRDILDMLESYQENV